MLPKSRIFSALLVGLGVALIVAGLVAPRFIVGDARMPLDMENTTYTLYDENGTVEGETTGVTRQLHMDIQNPANEDMASLRVGETLFEGSDGAEFDALLSAQTWNWELNRLTGEALSPATLSTVMVMPPESVEMDGPWIKLPTDFDEETAEIFDPFLREAAPATYTGSNDAGGAVNNYSQVVEPTNLATKYPAMKNTKMVNDEEDNAEQLFLTYEADRILSYEANTGVLVGMHEDVDLYYADREGNRVEDYVSYSAATADDGARVDELASVLSQSTSRTISVVMIVVGAVLALLGLIGALRPDRRQAKN